MYIRRPLIMKSPQTVPDNNGLKASIDAFLDMIITSGKDSFKADDDFGFSLEDYRFEIYNPSKGVITNMNKPGKKDIISSIEDPMYKHKINGTSVNANTFAQDLKNTISQYELRLRDVEVAMEFTDYGTLLLVSVKGVINDDHDTPYSYITNIRIW